MRKSFLVMAVLAAAVVALGTRARAQRSGTAQAPPAAQRSGTAQAPPADLVLTNGRIVTVDDGRPEAEAIAISKDRIEALGTKDEMKALIGPNTQVIDLQGQLAIPGFIESHGHFTGVGGAQLELNLMNVESWDKIVAMVAEAVSHAKPGEWIYGRGWHQEKWSARPSPNVEGFPTHASLDKVSPDNPVELDHASGHAAFVNAKAMELSGIRRPTESPSGGEILRDASGDATGLLRETAQRLIKRGAGAPAPTAEEIAARDRQVLELASKEVLSKGITTFEDAGSPLSTIDRMKEMVDAGKIGVRLWVMVRQDNAAIAPKLARYKMIDYADGHLTVRAIKKQIDGALGSRGAWLLAPYSDKPGSSGLETTKIAEIDETADLAMKNGFQLCVHAIGDRANRETLNIFERAFKANPGKKDLRWRVEHAQHISAQDIPRFGKMGVIASMQGIHCTSDAPYVLERLGEERAREGAYAWQKLMKTGAVIANGTDAPVEDVDPIPSYYASVSRKLKDGTVFFPDQRMSRMEALKSYTINGAYAAFEENNRGSLKPGKYADITVLSKDILKVPEDEIPTARVVYTIVGGKVLYKR
ncbi:MAG TPA: amidohydrolase [Vicinamibacterales bacterium]|nr:amidohydrolase [Vicinamibacterales bacterium]